MRPRAFARWSWQLTKEMVDEIGKDRVTDLAAAITFWTVLSIPALVLALVSALDSFAPIAGSDLVADVHGWINDFIEEQFVEHGPLQETVDDLFESSTRGVTVVASLVALFTMSRAFAGLIRALDAAYNVEDTRAWWHARIVAFALGLGTLVVVASAAVVLAFLPSLPFSESVRWLAVPIVLVVLTLWAATVFHIGPNHRTPWRYDLPGAIGTALGWVVSTQLFAVYIRVAGGANQVQSTVGAILLALTLLFVLSVVLIGGAELNQIVATRAGVVRRPRSMRAVARKMRDQYLARGAEPEDAELPEPPL